MSVSQHPSSMTICCTFIQFQQPWHLWPLHFCSWNPTFTTSSCFKIKFYIKKPLKKPVLLQLIQIFPLNIFYRSHNFLSGSSFLDNLEFLLIPTIFLYLSPAWRPDETVLVILSSPAPRVAAIPPYCLWFLLSSNDHPHQFFSRLLPVLLWTPTFCDIHHGGVARALTAQLCGVGLFLETAGLYSPY